MPGNVEKAALVKKMVVKCWKIKHLMRQLPACFGQEVALDATGLSHRFLEHSKLSLDNGSIFQK
jgi:hypothetical protein